MTDEFKEVRSNWVRFNKVDDYYKGVLLETYIPETPDQWGKRNRVAVFKTLEGSFHGNDANKNIDTEATIPAPGVVYRFAVKEALEGSFANMKIGQRVLLKLAELRATKKGNPAKIIKVYEGSMDQETLEEIKAKKDF